MLHGHGPSSERRRRWEEKEPAEDESRRGAYQVHKYVSDHQHALVMIVPSLVQRLKERVVIGHSHSERHTLEVLVHDLLQTVVQLVSIFVQHKIVRISSNENNFSS